MGFTLRGDLERFSRMAFVRAADCSEVIRRFHGLRKKARQGTDFGLLKKAYEWVFVPMSIWPVDVRGVVFAFVGLCRERTEGGRAGEVVVRVSGGRAG